MARNIIKETGRKTKDIRMYTVQHLLFVVLCQIYYDTFTFCSFLFLLRCPIFFSLIFFLCVTILVLWV